MLRGVRSEKRGRNRNQNLNRNRCRLRPPRSEMRRPYRIVKNCHIRDTSFFTAFFLSYVLLLLESRLEAVLSRIERTTVKRKKLFPLSPILLQQLGIHIGPCMILPQFTLHVALSWSYASLVLGYSADSKIKTSPIFTTPDLRLIEVTDY